MLGVAPPRRTMLPLRVPLPLWLPPTAPARSSRLSLVERATRMMPVAEEKEGEEEGEKDEEGNEPPIGECSMPCI